MKTLDYFRRFFATLFGFILFGVAGVLFKIALLPYTLKSTKGDIKRQLEARRMIGKVWRFFVGYLQWSGVLSVRFNGLEKLGRPGQLILANHPSLLDVVLLISHFPDPNVLVKKRPVAQPQHEKPNYRFRLHPQRRKHGNVGRNRRRVQKRAKYADFPRRHAHRLGRTG